MRLGIALLAGLLVTDGITSGIKLNVGDCKVEKTIEK